MDEQSVNAPPLEYPEWMHHLQRNLFALPKMDFQEVKKTEDEEEDEQPYYKRNENAETYSAEGRLVLDHPTFNHYGEDNPYRDLVMLSDPDVAGFVFGGIKIMNPLLYYNVVATLTGKELLGKKIARCTKIKTKPILPFTGDMVLRIMHAELLIEDFDKDAILKKFYTFAKIPPFEKGKTYDPQVIFKLFSSCEMFQVFLDVSIFSKQYFLHAELEILKKYYDEESLLTMACSKIIELLEVIKSEPLRLCFYTQNPFTRILKPDKFAEKDTGIKQNTHSPIPEITYDNLQKIVKTYKLKILKFKLLAVYMYDSIKFDRDDQKHCFSKKNEILNKGIELRIDMQTCINALLFIQEQGVIEIHGEEIFLKNVLMWERATSSALGIISKRMAEGNNINKMKTSNPFEIITKSGQPLCDEQRKAFELLCYSPFIVIAGGGGSGKTSLLDAYINNMINPKKDVLLLSWMGSNVGTLKRILPGRAFTIHIIMSVHYNTCSKNTRRTDMDRERDQANYPSRSLKKHGSKLGIDYDECIFEDIEELFIDEAGNNGSQLISLPITAAACCGKLKQVVYIGDHAQLQPIDIGTPFKKLIKAAETLGTCIKFKHNHRVTPDSQVLFDNSRAILNNKAQDIVFDNNVTFNYEIPYKTKIEDVVIAILDNHNIGEYEHQIITYTRGVRNRVQWAVDCYYYGKQHGGGGPRKRTHLVGRKITFKKNNYDLAVYNNDIYVITEIRDTIVSKNGTSTSHSRQGTDYPIPVGHTREIYVKSLYAKESDPAIVLQWDEWTRKFIASGSASTNHAFRGLEIKIIIYLMPWWSPYETNEALYTAFTRPTDGFFFVGDQAFLEKSIKNHESARNSNLDIDIISKCRQSIEKCRSQRIPLPDTPTINADDEWIDDEALNQMDTLIDEYNQSKPKETVSMFGARKPIPSNGKKLAICPPKNNTTKRKITEEQPKDKIPKKKAKKTTTITKRKTTDDQVDGKKPKKILKKK